VHLVGFIIRIYHDARSPELQKHRERIAALPLHEELTRTSNKITLYAYCLIL